MQRISLFLIVCGLIASLLSCPACRHTKKKDDGEYLIFGGLFLCSRPYKVGGGDTYYNCNITKKGQELRWKKGDKAIEVYVKAIKKRCLKQGGQLIPRSSEMSDLKRIKGASGEWDYYGPPRMYFCKLP